jgi:hypothetical protein
VVRQESAEAVEGGLRRVEHRRLSGAHHSRDVVGGRSSLLFRFVVLELLFVLMVGLLLRAALRLPSLAASETEPRRSQRIFTEPGAVR